LRKKDEKITPPAHPTPPQKEVEEIKPVIVEHASQCIATLFC
jgi:hypothetical protein